jgi:hypothetical protein
MPGNNPGHAESHQANTNRTRHGNNHDQHRSHTRMSEANVKIGPTET